jgi:hypothetical protein
MQYSEHVDKNVLLFNNGVPKTIKFVYKHMQ